MVNLIGVKFNRLLVSSVVLESYGTQGRKQNYALCQCDCGKKVLVSVSHLKRGHTQSCGCYKVEVAVRSNTSHGMTGTREYYAWNNMILRCSDPNNVGFGRYLGRGIGVCDRWLKFENFYKDMGNCLSGLELDRIDNNKGYYKENCRWTTEAKNSQNTRKSKYWYVDGSKYVSSSVAAKALGVSQPTVHKWCNGKVDGRTGKYYPPKKNCYSELKYK